MLTFQLILMVFSVFLCVSSIFVICQAFWVVPENTAEPAVFFASPYLKRLKSAEVNYPVTGQLVMVEQMYPDENVQDKIVVYKHQDFVKNENIFNFFRAFSLKALIVVMNSHESYPGYGEYSTQLSDDHFPLPFPVFEITLAQEKAIKQLLFHSKQKWLPVAFEAEEPNPWSTIMTEDMPYIARILLLSSLPIIILCISKTFNQLANFGLQASSSLLILLLNLSGLVIHLAWTATNPFMTCVHCSYTWSQLGMTLPFAFVIGSLLILSVHFHELISILTGKKSTSNNDVLLGVSFVAVIIVIIQEFFVANLRGLNVFSPVMNTMNVVVYGLVIIFVLVTFGLNGLRVFFLCRHGNAVSIEKLHPLRSACYLVVTITGIMLIWMSSMITNLISSAIGRPEGYKLIFTVSLLSAQTLSFLHILFVRSSSCPSFQQLCSNCMPDPSLTIVISPAVSKNLTLPIKTKKLSSSDRIAKKRKAKSSTSSTTKGESDRDLTSGPIPTTPRSDDR